jgi:hypothetical protein
MGDMLVGSEATTHYRAETDLNLIKRDLVASNSSIGSDNSAGNMEKQLHFLYQQRKSNGETGVKHNGGEM